MRATDYFEKYGKDIAAVLTIGESSSGEEKATAHKTSKKAIEKLATMFTIEYRTIRDSRNAMTIEAKYAIAKELDRKFQKVNRLMVKTYGSSPMSGSTVKDALSQLLDFQQ